MRIQVIQHSNNAAVTKEGILFSPMRAPSALDDYDINFLDLSVPSMWRYKYSSNVGQVDTLPDLQTLQQMVTNKKKAIVVYVMPQNITYTYDLQYSSSYDQVPIKDKLAGIYHYSIANAIPSHTMMTNLAFEKTNTNISGKTYDADFYLVNPAEIVTKSDRSEKPTTVRICENVYVTTLAVTKTIADIKHYVSALFEEHERETAPEWMNTISFGDDAFQNSQIEQCKAEIEAANAKICDAEAKLKENAKYKSILYTNGNELVDVVFEILEKILGYDLSTFIDDKKEDFLIKLPSCTFIGEIKGVTSNVKYEHISQLELHYRSYLDRLAENRQSENVKQLLIMNPFRTKAVDRRDPVHISQIDLAIRNGCLIIETNTLLRLYERFCNGEVTSQKCIEVLLSRTGLLCLADFDKDAGDIEPYKV